jgi:hypothetical protein
MSPAEIDQCLDDVRQGRVHTLENITGMLRCCKETTRKIFNVEPGVVRFNHMYRVPDTVLERVLRRMMQRNRAPSVRGT